MNYEAMTKKELISELMALKNKYDNLTQHDNQLNELIESQIDLVCRFTPEGIFTYANQAYREFFGKTEAEIIGKTWHPMALVDDLPLIDHLLSKITKENPIAIIENRVKTLDGSTRWFQFINQGFFNHNGCLYEIQSTGRDITALKNLTDANRNCEKKYRDFVENLNEGIWALNTDGETILVNQKMCKMLGYAESEILGRPVKDFLADYSQAVFETHMKNRRKGKKEEYLDFLDRDGRVVNTLIKGTPLLDHEGNYIGSWAGILNITEQNKEDSSLLFQSIFSATILENIGAGVVVCDEKGNLVLFNRLAREWHGLDALEMPQSEWAGRYDLFLADGVTPMDISTIPLARAFRGEVINGFEMVVAAKCLPKRHLMANSAPLKTPDGKILGAVAVLHDVTQIKIAEKQREELQMQLLHSSRLTSLGTLAAGVGHEINNPLMIILGNLSLLRDKTRDPESLVILEKLKKAVRRIANIVDGLRSFARNKNTLMEKIDIHKVITETLSLCKDIYRKSGLDIHVDFQSKNPIVVANTGKIQQVVMNLIANAHDATEGINGGGVLKIETFNTKDRLIMRFSDNGAGIEKEHLPHIFDPFYTTKEPNKGTGLGLSICYKILEEFKGYIGVDTDVSVGTCFEISLPISIDRSIEENFPKGPGNLIHLYGKVLIIDDEPDILNMLEDFLKNIGLTVTTVDNGDVALDKLKHNTFDYIITDLKLPGRSGDQILTEAQKLPHLKNAFFIVITGAIITEYSQEQRNVIRDLADGYLRKPFDKDEIINLLMTKGAGISNTDLDG